MKALKLIVVTLLLVVFAYSSNANAADLSQAELQPTSRLEVVEINSKDVVENSTDVAENLNSDNKLLEIEDSQKAIVNFTKAIEINPNDADAYYYRGNFRIQSKDYQGAIADFTKAIEINPKDAQSYYNRSLARVLLGDKQEAIADLEKVTSIFQKPSEIKTFHCNLVCCYNNCS